MSEIKNTQENETKSDVPEEAEQALSELVRRYWSKPGTYATPADERLRYEIFTNLITLYKDVLDKRIHATPADERLLREALTNLMTGHKEGPYEESDFNEALFEWLLRTEAKYELVREHSEANWEKIVDLILNALIHGRSTHSIQIIRSLVSEEEPIKIQLRIIEEPLTPQNLALILTALTELTTKLWLIEKHRFADLIEYTQTHDIRLANEAGTTIAWATYNSPFSFGFQVDKLVPGVAEAVMTVVDGLSQRKAHLEKLEIENMAAAQKIRETEENLKQQQEMAALEREKQSIVLERLRLENEKERQALVEQRLESQRKQIKDALELAGKAVDIVYPNADADMRPMLIQAVMNNILQLLSATGLELILILPENKDEDNPKEDMEQT